MGIRIHQRGFALPTWAIYALAAAAALWALWWAYDTIDGRGYARGKAETDAAYLKRDNTALQSAIAEKARLQAEVNARAAAHDAELQAIATRNIEEKRNADRQRDAEIAAAVAGTVRLRDPGAAARTADGGAGPQGEAAAATGQCDAASSSELSGAAAGFLLGLVHEADDVARQLGDAQAVIRAQIKACNGS